MSINFNDQNWSNPGSLPLPLKAGLLAIPFVLVALVASYFIYWGEDSQYDQLMAEQGQEVKLKQEFTTKADQAKNFEAYEEQKRQLNSMLQDQLKMLPNSNEVAQLLSDISKTATDNGLKLEMINWAPEVKREMYTEIPMNIVISGDYEKMGNFTADVASLNRIVVIEEFVIEHYNNTTDELKMSMVAKTYRYDGDNAQGKGAAKNGDRK